MAALKNNGQEVARIRVPRSIGGGATHDVLFSLRTNGRILVNYGQGWKLLDGYKRVALLHVRKSVYGSPVERMHKLLEEPGAKIEVGALPAVSVPQREKEMGLKRDAVQRAQIPGENASRRKRDDEQAADADEEAAADETL